MADIVLDFATKIRNKPVSDGFLRSLDTALSATDPRLGARIISGGQPPKGKGGRRTGSTRHDVDKSGHAHTGDLVLTIDGKDVLPGEDKQLYASFFRNAAPFFPGIGHYKWGVHVGSGTTAAWGPTKSKRSLDPVFAAAIRDGRTGRKPKEIAPGLVADATPSVAPGSAVPGPKPNPRGIAPREAVASPREVPRQAVDVRQLVADVTSAFNLPEPELPSNVTGTFAPPPVASSGGTAIGTGGFDIPAQDTFITPVGEGAVPGPVPSPVAAAEVDPLSGQPDGPVAVVAGVFDPTQFGAVLIQEPAADTPAAVVGDGIASTVPTPAPETALVPPAPVPAAETTATPVAAAGTPIDLSRPRIDNADGSFSTERTITIDEQTSEGQRFFNIPTIVNGQELSEEDAVALFRAGRNPAVGTFGTLNEALQAAQARSNRIGELRGAPADVFDPTQFGAVPIDEPLPAPVEGSAVSTAAPASAATVSEDPGFFDRIGERLSVRGKQFEQIGRRIGGQTTEETLLQSAGTTVGGAFDVLGEAIATAGSGVADVFNSLAPETGQAIADAWAAAVGSDVAQAGLAALQAGQETYGVWAAENPRAAANLEAFVNIGLAAAPTPKGLRAPGTARKTPIGRAGARVEARAVTQEAATKKAFVDDLILPKQTPTVLAEQAGRTDPKGLVGLTSTQADMASAVTKVPTVKSSNTLRENLQAVTTEVTKAASALETELAAKGLKIPRRIVDAEFDDLLTAAKATPSVGAKPGNAMKKAIDVAKSKIGKSPTATSLLDARRSFDVSVLRSGIKLKPGPKATAAAEAAAEVRRTMNDLIARFAPDVDVRGSLRKQSDLLSAADNISAKAGAEATTPIRRLIQRLEKRASLKQSIAGLATLATVGIGSSIVDAGVLASGALIAISGKKILMSSQTKRALAGLLRETDLAIRVAGRGAKRAQDLRADRAVLIDMLRDSEVVNRERRAPSTTSRPARPSGTSSLGDRLREQFGAAG